MLSLILRSLIPLAIVLPVYAEVREIKSICSWMRDGGRFKCKSDQFQCLNDKCVPRSYYCDSGNDCGDSSDESYCNTNSCPREFFIRCKNSRKCIPLEWICDGQYDCPSQDDERGCSPLSLGERRPLLSNTERLRSLNNVLKWLGNQRMQNSTEKWGASADRIALIHYFSDTSHATFHEQETGNEIAYELNIQLLSRLTRTKLNEITSTELASYVNAFLVMCVNPRNFHGYDIVQELRHRVDQKNYTNPYTLLALCNAGETITDSDKKKLIDTFWNRHRTFWTDMQAVVVMALACANEQPGNEVDSDTLSEMTLELKQQQFRNGSVVNLPTTALVMQALISTNSEKDPDNFDEVKAVDELVRNQRADGSFGDLMNTLLVTPVLYCKSLTDITSDHCHYGSQNEISALENLSRRSGPKVRVHYSLWIGKEKDLERNLILRVPQNMSLYGVMEIAAEIDSRFKFEYSVKNRKPYVTALSGMRDNPMTGKFWFLYLVQDGQPTLSSESPADIIPKDNDQYVMWYRRGTWVD